MWCGANLTAVLPTDDDHETDDARAEVAATIVSRLSRPAALVGEAELTLDLWGRVEPWWGPARQLRPSPGVDGDQRRPRDVPETPRSTLEPMRRGHDGRLRRTCFPPPRTCSWARWATTR